jgi:adenine-specific DNA-methyltransferase
MSQNAYLHYNIDIKSVNDNFSDFERLSVKEQNKFLIEALNKNQLYVNYSEIRDKDYKVSEADIRLNALFYSEK